MASSSSIPASARMSTILTHWRVSPSVTPPPPRPQRPARRCGGTAHSSPSFSRLPLLVSLTFLVQVFRGSAEMRILPAAAADARDHLRIALLTAGGVAVHQRQ